MYLILTKIGTIWRISRTHSDDLHITSFRRQWFFAVPSHATRLHAQLMSSLCSSETLIQSQSLSTPLDVAWYIQRTDHHPTDATSAVCYCSSRTGASNPPPHYGWEINPHIWHGEAQFTLFGPNMEAWSYSLALRNLDTLMWLSESPQY